MPANEDELYQERILDHYETPYHRGHCPQSTHVHEDDNPLCGDVVRLELEIDPDAADSASVFRRRRLLHQPGGGVDAGAAYRRKIARGVADASADDMLRLFGARLTPNRQKCCLLPWRVLQVALRSPVECGDVPPAPKRPR